MTREPPKLINVSYQNSHDDTDYNHDVATILMNDWVTQMTNNPFHYTWLHLDPPDHYGHKFTWDLGISPNLSQYMLSVKEVDDYLGTIFHLITNDLRFIGRTAVILTADHGGVVGSTGHGTVDDPGDFRVNFMVWGPGVAPGADLYALNPQYVKPASGARPDYFSPDQPIGYIEAVARITTDAREVRVEWRIEDVVAKVLATAKREGLAAEIAEPVWRELIERCIEHEGRSWREQHEPAKNAVGAG